MLAMPDGSSVPYVAARFYDEKYDWRDDSGGLGRKISHEIMLLIPENNEIALLDSNWPQAIMNVLRPIYSDLYPISRKEIMHYAKTNYLETKKLVVHRIPEVGQIFELLEVMGLIASNPEKSSDSAIEFNSNAYLLRLLIAFTGLSIIAIFAYIILYYFHIQ